VKASLYNFAFPVEEGQLLYNSRTGSVFLTAGEDANNLAVALIDPNFTLEKDDSSLIKSLVEGAFIIPNNFDELSAIREIYLNARNMSPMVVTITTTMDCNLGCYYCYESRTKESLDENQIPALLEKVEKNLLRQSKKSLHVDWYGGEPLLNAGFLEDASIKLQELCRNLNIKYSSSVVSNGTEWPVDVDAFVKKHKIRQVQISIDGLEKNHNKRRKYKSGDRKRSSFDKAVTVINGLVKVCRVDLRLNIDQHNYQDFDLFLTQCEHRGWFDAPFPVVVQPARISSYSDKSSFLRPHEITLSKFDSIRGEIRKKMKGIAKVEESESPDGFPFPKVSVCAALATDSFVMGAAGEEYRCGLQVGEENRIVGRVAPALKKKINNISIEVVSTSDNEKNHSDQKWWDTFDPTRNLKCSQCSFLPLCWGGCPKKHLENDDGALDEQSEYWKSNLARLVIENLQGVTSKPVDYCLKESHQFRK